MTIFENINHDAGGTPNAFWTKSVSDPSSRLVVNAAAGLNGTANGLQCTFTTGDSAATVKEGLSAPGSNEFRLRLRWDPNGAPTPTSATQNLCVVQVRDSAATFTSFLIDIELQILTSGQNRVRFFYSSDASQTLLVIVNIPDAEVCIEMVAKRATGASSNDGEYHAYINESIQASVTNVDNFDHFPAIDEIQATFNALGAGMNNTVTFLDEIVLDNDSTANLCAATPATMFRFLGMDAHSGVLMVTGLKDEATLQSYVYTDLDSLTEGGTIDSFGAATDAEIDALTKGIFPVARPMWDDVWYMRGRDGSQVQLYYNDRNGTIGWTDIGPGTATWGTAKYAVGLWPEPTVPDDVVIAFSDSDVYRSRYGTSNWVQMGSAPFALRAGARHIGNRFNELLLGGGGGTLAYSPNFGVSYDGAVGGTIAGTINAIEVSL